MSLELAGGAWAFLAAAVSATVSFAVARVTAQPAQLTVENEVEARLWQRVRDELDRYEAEVQALRVALQDCVRGRTQIEGEMQSLRLAMLNLSQRVEGTHDG